MSTRAFISKNHIKYGICFQTTQHGERERRRTQLKYISFLFVILLKLGNELRDDAIHCPPYLCVHLKFFTTEAS